VHYGPQYGHAYAMPHPAPPDPPERPEGLPGFPRWPAWYAPAAFFTGMVALAILGGIAGAATGGDIGTGTGLILTVALEATFVVIAVLFAARTERPRAAHFGLRAAPLWRTVGWAALGWASFFVVSGIYGVLIKDRPKQPLLNDIKSEDDLILVVGFAVLAIVCAPIAEEFFFRGFFYRALRSRMSVVVAAVLDGVIFGLIHYDGSNTLVALPVLALLGLVFCLVYEKTGTLFSTIALHALNNTIAVGVSTDDWGLALGLGFSMLAACVVLPRVLGTGARRPPARAPARA
jgi:membrane protease YdiL (CAAX protease family)